MTITNDESRLSIVEMIIEKGKEETTHIRNENKLQQYE
jgi:hypothetical protein